MGRISVRNFLTLFRAVGVDAAERGPDVAEDVQMVYVVDDVRQHSNIDAGAGGTEAAVIAEHGFIGLECRVPGGLEVVQITMSILTPAFGADLRVWTSGAQPVLTGPATMVTALRTTGLQGLPAAPLSISTRATIATAAIPATAFRYVDVHGFQPPFFINQGQFFNVANGASNVAVDVGIRWRELRLFS